MGEFRSHHQRKVDQFMVLAKQELPNYPMMPCEAVRKLRAKLIFEECLETIEALGFDVKVLAAGGLDGFSEVRKDSVVFESNGKEDLVEITDGCCDIRVVTTGTLSACGIPDEVVQDEVDNNNLAKFGPGHSWRDDGKLIKPADHKPPRIAEIIARLRPIG